MDDAESPQRNIGDRAAERANFQVAGGFGVVASPPEEDEPVLAWEFYARKHPGARADVLERWNKLPLAERAPFLSEASRAADAKREEQQLRNKKNASAYQYFIAEQCRQAAQDHPELSLPELTKRVLAPRWQRLQPHERATYNKLAEEDAQRYRTNKRQRRADSAATHAAANAHRVIESEPLSAFGIFMAASWDSVEGTTEAAREEGECTSTICWYYQLSFYCIACQQLWLDMTPEQQAPWLRRAAENQKVVSACVHVGEA